MLTTTMPTTIIPQLHGSVIHLSSTDISAELKCQINHTDVPKYHIQTNDL